MLPVMKIPRESEGGVEFRRGSRVKTHVRLHVQENQVVNLGLC